MWCARAVLRTNERRPAGGQGGRAVREPMPNAVPKKEFSRFVLMCFERCTVEQRYAMIRYTNTEWVGQFRRLLARWSQYGPGWFYTVEARMFNGAVARRRRGGRVSELTTDAADDILYMTHTSHPSLSRAACLDLHPDSASEASRRDADALLLAAVRLCDAAEPLDTLCIDRSLLARPAVLWRSLTRVSAGRFAEEPHHAPASAALANSRAKWFRGRSFWSVGSFLASRLHLQILIDVQSRLAHTPVPAAPAAPRRVPAAWWAELDTAERTRLLLLWAFELKSLLMQRRRLLGLTAAARASGPAPDASVPPSAKRMEGAAEAPRGAQPLAGAGTESAPDVVVLAHLVESLTTAPFELPPHAHGAHLSYSRSYRHRHPPSATHPWTANLLSGRSSGEWPPQVAAAHVPRVILAGLCGARPAAAASVATAASSAASAAALAAAAAFLEGVYERPLSRLGGGLDLSCRKLAARLDAEHAACLGAELVRDEARALEQHALKTTRGNEPIALKTTSLSGGLSAWVPPPQPTGGVSTSDGSAQDDASARERAGEEEEEAALETALVDEETAALQSLLCHARVRTSQAVAAAAAPVASFVCSASSSAFASASASAASAAGSVGSVGPLRGAASRRGAANTAYDGAHTAHDGARSAGCSGGGGSGGRGHCDCSSASSSASSSAASRAVLGNSSSASGSHPRRRAEPPSGSPVTSASAAVSSTVSASFASAAAAAPASARPVPASSAAAPSAALSATASSATASAANPRHRSRSNEIERDRARPSEIGSASAWANGPPHRAHSARADARGGARADARRGARGGARGDGRSDAPALAPAHEPQLALGRGLAGGGGLSPTPTVSPTMRAMAPMAAPAPPPATAHAAHAHDAATVLPAAPPLLPHPQQPAAPLRQPPPQPPPLDDANDPMQQLLLRFGSFHRRWGNESTF